MMPEHDEMEMLIGGSGVAATTRDEQAGRSHFIAGENAERTGNRLSAIEEYRLASRYDPENLDATFRLAYHLDLVGEADEAIAMYEQCLDVNEEEPAYINVLMNLAVLYEDQGSYRRAEKCLRQILDTDPNHARAQLFMRDVQSSFEMEVEEEEDLMFSVRNAQLDTPVTDFELSVRARNCLKKMNIRTLGDLLRITEAELLGYKNFGETSLHEIKEMLQARSMRLGQGLEEQQDAVRQTVYDQVKGSPQEYMLNKPVSDLQLSVRARKALQALDVNTIGDLCARTEAELLGIKNFGSTSLVEVNIKLSEIGLKLRQLEETEEGSV